VTGREGEGKRRRGDEEMRGKGEGI